MRRCGARKYVSGGREGCEAARCGAAGACRGCITRGEGEAAGTGVQWCPGGGCKDVRKLRGKEDAGFTGAGMRGCREGGVQTEYAAYRGVGVQECKMQS